MAIILESNNLSYLNNPDYQYYSNTKNNPFVNYSSPIADSVEYSTIQDLFKGSNIENLLNQSQGNKRNNNSNSNAHNNNVTGNINGANVENNYNPLEVKKIDEEVLKQVNNHKSKTFRKVGPQIDSTVDFKGDKYTDKYEVIEQNQPKIGFYGKTRLSR